MKKLYSYGKKILQNKIFRIILWGIIFLYPLINSFLGVDLGDTGIHYLNFKYLFSKPEIVGFSSFFTSLVGWGWLQIFEGLGLWGLNFLEVIVEWVLAVIAYRLLSPYFDRTFILIGISISIIAAGCYLNVFNYHQFSVLLIAAMLLFLFKANITDKLCFSLVSGVFLGLAIAARISSLACLVCVTLYIYWYFINKDSHLKHFLLHLFCYISGALIVCAIFFLIMKLTGEWEYFMTSITKLQTMATDASSAYNSNRLIQDFIFGNLNTLASGVLTMVAAIIFAFGFDLICRKPVIWKKQILNIFIGVIFIFISIVTAVYSYDVNPVINSPQFTTGPNYISGILYLITFILFGNTYFSQKNLKENQKSLIYLIAVFLPLLTVAGSNTQTKHIIISMWFLAPVAVNAVGSLFLYPQPAVKMEEFFKKTGVNISKRWLPAGILFFTIIVGYKFLHMIYWTNNFESVNRLEITEKVDSPVLKFLRTTEREANALNSIINHINEIKEVKEQDNMVVFGSGVMLYEILEATPNIRFWVTDSSYSYEQFEEDLYKKASQKNELPIIVYCRTNQYFGFNEEDYNSQIEMIQLTSFNGKKGILLNYLYDGNYVLSFQNDYYYVFVPEQYSAGTSYDEYYSWL